MWSSVAIAEQREVSILAPWTAEGKTYKVGPSQRQFVGVFKGIMYADNNEGEMHTALFVCPAVHLLDTESSKTEASGRCHIVATEGNMSRLRKRFSQQPIFCGTVKRSAVVNECSAGDLP